MARQRGSDGGGRPLTPERAARLARLVNLLADKPPTREEAATALEIDLRSFYRDLEVLRGLGVSVTLRASRYRLTGSPDAALALLPLPDPQLTIGEAVRLAQSGDSTAHQRLRRVIREATGRPVPRRRRDSAATEEESPPPETAEPATEATELAPEE